MNQTNTETSRREFLKGSAAAVAAGALSSSLSSRAFAAGNEELKVGLVGCGGRGTGAAFDALFADANTRLVAMGDLFPDRLAGSLKKLKSDARVVDRISVTPDTSFTGFDAYKQVIDASDVVLLATSPHYRAIHLKYAVNQGKHVFAEKPVATDSPMLRDVYETCQVAKQKNLAIVSGLCWRYHQPKVETMRRVLDGEIGDVVAIETAYLAGTLWHRGDKPGWTPMEYQNRNWLYYNWLSGDQPCEQAIHSIDKQGWAMREVAPKSCIGVGGRQVRTDQMWGNVYDHFHFTFEYDNGVRAYHQCRQMAGTRGQVRDYIMGTKGIADVFGHKLVSHSGDVMWRYKGKSGSMYRNEHIELFKSIRAGKPINNGEYMCKSNMLAIMGRMAAYTGQKITWDQAWHSDESLAPAKYEWGPAPEHPVAMPGKPKTA